MVDAYISETKTGRPKRVCRICALERAKEKYKDPEVKARMAAYAREWRIKNRDKVTADRKKRQEDGKVYPSMVDRRFREKGITRAIFEDALAKQGGRCAICEITIREEMQIGSNRVKTMTINTAVIDHCHATGKFRGLLCMRCNKAAGYVLDNPDTARKLAAYLEAHK